MTMEVTMGKDKAKKKDKKGNGDAPEAEGAAVLPVRRAARRLAGTTSPR